MTTTEVQKELSTRQTDRFLLNCVGLLTIFSNNSSNYICSYDMINLNNQSYQNEIWLTYENRSKMDMATQQMAINNWGQSKIKLYIS